MYNLYYFKFSNFKSQLNEINDLRDLILRFVFNSSLENSLQKDAIINSTYYAVLLSRTSNVKYTDYLKVLNNYNQRSNINYQIFFNYNKIIRYIHEYALKSEVDVNIQFISNLNKILTGNENSMILLQNNSDSLDELYKLIKFLFDRDVNSHEVSLKAAIFMINFLRLSPYSSFNELTAFSLTLLCFYKFGYSLNKVFSPETYLYKRQEIYNRYYRLIVLDKEWKNYDLYYEFVYFYLDTIKTYLNELKSLIVKN